MRIKISISIILIFCCGLLNGQDIEIKNLLSELFYGVSASPSKFEIRTLLHGNKIFHSYFSFDTDKFTSMSAKVNDNKQLSYSLGLPINVCFWIPPEEEYSDSRKIDIEYPINNLSECIEQVSEVYKMFVKYSHKAERIETRGNFINGKDEKIGEGWAFFNSDQNLEDDNPYMQVFYRYIKLESQTINKEYYIFDISFWNKGLTR
jgi:hypothetical protein